MVARRNSDPTSNHSNPNSDYEFRKEYDYKLKKERPNINELRKFDEREYRVKAEIRLLFIITLTTLVMGVFLICGAFFLAFTVSSDKLLPLAFVACGTVLVTMQYTTGRMSKGRYIYRTDLDKNKSSVSAYINELNNSK